MLSKVCISGLFHQKKYHPGISEVSIKNRYSKCQFEATIGRINRVKTENLIWQPPPRHTQLVIPPKNQINETFSPTSHQWFFVHRICQSNEALRFCARKPIAEKSFFISSNVNYFLMGSCQMANGRVSVFIAHFFQRIFQLIIDPSKDLSVGSISTIAFANEPAHTFDKFTFISS